FKSSAASPSLYGRVSTFLRAFSTCFPEFFIRYLVRPLAPEPLGFHDFQAHVARRAHHGAHRGLQTGGVEVDKLDLRNLFHLLLRDLPDFIAVRLCGALGDVRGALQQNRGRRCLKDESKRSVGVDRYEHRENHPIRLFRRLGIELLAKIHDVQTMGAERRAYRRRRCGLTSGQLQLNGCLNLLCHVPASISRLFAQCAVYPSFSTLAKSSSTGVDRPKIVTETFNRL